MRSINGREIRLRFLLGSVYKIAQSKDMWARFTSSILFLTLFHFSVADILDMFLASNQNTLQSGSSIVETPVDNFVNTSNPPAVSGGNLILEKSSVKQLALRKRLFAETTFPLDSAKSDGLIRNVVSFGGSSRDRNRPLDLSVLSLQSRRPPQLLKFLQLRTLLIHQALPWRIGGGVNLYLRAWSSSFYYIRQHFIVQRVFRDGVAPHILTCKACFFPMQDISTANSLLREKTLEAFRSSSLQIIYDTSAPRLPMLPQREIEWTKSRILYRNLRKIELEPSMIE